MGASGTIQLGCDPELFFTRNGKVVGAERVLPPSGYLENMSASTQSNVRGVVLDGVQVELNPPPSHCRQVLATDIARAFGAIAVRLKETPGITCSFSTLVDVDQKELETLSDKARILGCAPSLNVYDPSSTITVNAATYTKRSAGGHLHFGLNANLHPHRGRMVHMLDILLGNFCVMLDRDGGAEERRKVYGKAGEHRLPNHGLEYRTISNFWLQAVPLMSMVFGIGRQAINAVSTTVLQSHPSYGDPEKDILLAVDLAVVQETINRNDAVQARRNWDDLLPVLKTHTAGLTSGITAANLPVITHFLDRSLEKGLGYWFTEDPMTHWTDSIKPNRGWPKGWEFFLDHQVLPDMKRQVAVPASFITKSPTVEGQEIQI